MKTSRSIVSGSSRAARYLLVFLAAAFLIAVATPAEASKVVVLDFTGPKAAKFQVDVEKALKKGNTLVPKAKWKKTAKQLKATKVNAKNVKKVAKKMKVDAVVTGSVTRRGTRYRVNVVMRSGKSGESVAEVEVTAKKPKLSAREISDVKAQLLPALDDIGSGGGDDAVASNDDDDSGFKGKSDDGGELRGKDRVGGDEGEGVDETAAEDTEAPTPTAEPEETRVAATDDESGGGGGGGSADADVAASGAVGTIPLTMRTAFADLTVGVSGTARSLDFTAVGADPPSNYSSSLVAGAQVAADIYPLAFGRKSKGITSNLGITAVFDRVIKLESEAPDGTKLPTTEQRWGVGLIYRQPIGDSLWVEGSVRYSQLQFEIDDAADAADVPNVLYTYVDPGVGARYLISPKISAGLEVRVPLALDAGEIDDAEGEGLGSATLTAIEAEVAADYLITSNIFARLGARFMTWGYAFDDETVVSGARDTYYGGHVLAGYLF